mmetsp:Transcript_39529/g.58084  ORF Transcript_39529/g.58084 Transcript_39529/m.58084 type:complete len:365 (+) Transcript_39529:257-1351(+)
MFKFLTLTGYISSLLLFHVVCVRGRDKSDVTRRLDIVKRQNGDECAENSQCISNCCSVFLFGDETCQTKKWWRTCRDGYHFRSDNQGQCLSGSSTNMVKLMSYNVYMIALASDITSMHERQGDLLTWFAEEGSEHDIIVIQENWINPEKIKNGLVAAGYCHYAIDDRGHSGSGLAVFSKYPIEEHDFRGFGNSCADFDCAIDKGVIYAKIIKDGNYMHVFGTHAISSVANHDTRLEQFDVMHNFMNEKSISSDYVFMMGDFNEDKIATPDKYDAMLNSLNAAEIQLVGSPYSYNPDENTLISSGAIGSSTGKHALDFIFYHNKQGLKYPSSDSECEYITPRNAAGKDLSDHYPIACTIVLLDEL